MNAPSNNYVDREKVKAEAFTYTCLSMPVGAAIGYLGAASFTVINPAAGAWLGFGVLPFNTMSLFFTGKCLESTEISQCKAIATYSIVWLSSTILGAALLMEAAELTLTAAEVMALIAADLALIGSGIGIVVIGVTVYYCAAKYFCPEQLEKFKNDQKPSSAATKS